MNRREVVTIDGHEHTVRANPRCTDRIDCDTCDVADIDPYQHAEGAKPRLYRRTNLYQSPLKETK